MADPTSSQDSKRRDPQGCDDAPKDLDPSSHLEEGDSTYDESDKENERPPGAPPDGRVGGDTTDDDVFMNRPGPLGEIKIEGQTFDEGDEDEEMEYDAGDDAEQEDGAEDSDAAVTPRKRGRSYRRDVEETDNQ